MYISIRFQNSTFVSSSTTLSKLEYYQFNCSQIKDVLSYYTKSLQRNQMEFCFIIVALHICCVFCHDQHQIILHLNIEARIDLDKSITHHMWAYYTNDLEDLAWRE